MEKKKQISKALLDWIIATLQSGVRPEAIVDAMVRKGYDERFSYTVLFKIIGNRPVETVEKKEMPYIYETPPLFTKGNTIEIDDRAIKVLTKLERPYLIYMENVLSDDECEMLIDLAKDRLKPNTVIDPETGKEVIGAGRTSKGMSFAFNETPFITMIEERIAAITGHPIGNGEGLQVLNYKKGEEYKHHYDYFPEHKVDPTKGGQRISTFLLYLNDVPAGGETIFPNAKATIVPKKGAAVYFHYCNSRGQVDRLSLHSSVPVAAGEKWVATKWIREDIIYDHLK